MMDEFPRAPDEYLVMVAVMQVCEKFLTFFDPKLRCVSKSDLLDHITCGYYGVEAIREKFQNDVMDEIVSRGVEIENDAWVLPKNPTVQDVIDHCRELCRRVEVE